MPDPILSDEERDAAFEASLPKVGMTMAQKAELRAEHDREMAEHLNARFDVQKNYDIHKGRR
jgi:hypothetical protein